MTEANFQNKTGYTYQKKSSTNFKSTMMADAEMLRHTGMMKINKDLVSDLTPIDGSLP